MRGESAAEKAFKRGPVTTRRQAEVRGEDPTSKARAPRSERTRFEQRRNQEVLRQYGRPGLTHPVREFQGSGYAPLQVAAYLTTGYLDPVHAFKGWVEEQRGRTERGEPPRPLDVAQVAVPWKGNFEGLRLVHGTDATYRRIDPERQHPGIYGIGHYMAGFELRPGQFADPSGSASKTLRGRTRSRHFASFTNANDFGEQLRRAGYEDVSVVQTGARTNRRMQRALVEAGRPSVTLRSGKQRPKTEATPIRVSWTEPSAPQFKLHGLKPGTRVLDLDKPVTDEEIAQAENILRGLERAMNKRGYRMNVWDEVKAQIKPRQSVRLYPDNDRFASDMYGFELADLISRAVSKNTILDPQGKVVPPARLSKHIMRRLGYQAGTTRFPRPAEVTEHFADRVTSEHGKHRGVEEALKEMGMERPEDRAAFRSEHVLNASDREVVAYDPGVVENWFGPGFYAREHARIMRTTPETIANPEEGMWVSRYGPPARDPSGPVVKMQQHPLTGENEFYFKTKQGRYVRISEERAAKLVSALKAAEGATEGTDITPEALFREVWEQAGENELVKGAEQANLEQNLAWLRNPDLGRKTREPQSQAEVEEYLRSLGDSTETRIHSGTRVPDDSEMNYSRDGVPIWNFPSPPDWEEFVPPGYIELVKRWSQGDEDLFERTMEDFQRQINEHWYKWRSRAVRHDQGFRSANPPKRHFGTWGQAIADAFRRNEQYRGESGK